MKILCLHGFRHNSALLAKSMQPLIKKFSKLDIHFDFLDSPIKYVGDDANGSEYLQWWSATKTNVLTLDTFDTWEQSLKCVVDKWNGEHYDGIMGFSQGSILAQLFCYAAEQKTITVALPKFAILCSTFPISDVKLREVYKDKLLTPCIITYGLKDDFVPQAVTKEVVAHMNNCVLIEHPGGHYVSSTANTCSVLGDHLKTIMSQLNKK